MDDLLDLSASPPPKRCATGRLAMPAAAVRNAPLGAFENERARFKCLIESNLHSSCDALDENAASFRQGTQT